MATTQDIDQHLEAVILPVLKQYGALVVARNDESFYDLLIIEFRGQRIALSRPVIDRNDPKALRLFFRHFDALSVVVADLMQIADPFYSDISVALDSLLRGTTPDERSLAFHYVCERLRAAGKRIWTND
jgi:hypothetical protein